MSEVFWIGGENQSITQEEKPEKISGLFRNLLSHNGVNPSWVDEFHLFSNGDPERENLPFPSASVHIWPSASLSSMWLFQSFCRAVLLGSSHLLAAAEEGQNYRSALLLASPRLIGMNNLLPEGSLEGFFSAGGAALTERQKLNLLFNKLSQNGFFLDSFSRVTGSLLSQESKDLLSEGFGERFIVSESPGIVSMINTLSAELSSGESGLVLQMQNDSMGSLIFEKI